MEILVLIYTAWAIYSGFKVVSGRNSWLDTKKPINIIVKIFLSILVGYVIAAFYLIYLIVKALTKIAKII